MCGKAWSEKEVANLRYAYTNYGIKGCAEILNERSRRSVYAKRNKLSLHVKNRFWSAKEDNLLKNFYPSEGVKSLVNLLPKRSFKAIQKRAFDLNVKVIDFGLLISGSKNPNWRGGKSFEPYGLSFNSKFKKIIYDVYALHCLNCGGVGMRGKLDVHHIDYNKQNNLFVNLIPLCPVCHGKSNYNRGVWKIHSRFLQEQFWEREGRFPTEDGSMFRTTPERGACLAPSAPLTHSNFEPTSPPTAKRFSAFPKLRMDEIARRDGCA
jgi:hypothetical protein